MSSILAGGAKRSKAVALQTWVQRFFYPCSSRPPPFDGRRGAAGVRNYLYAPVDQTIEARIVCGAVHENGMGLADAVAADLSACGYSIFSLYLFASSSLKQCSDNSPVESKIHKDTKSP